MTAFFVMLLFAWLGHAQMQDPPAAAYAVPISRNRLVLEFASSDGAGAKVTVLEGAMVRVRRAGGPTAALVARRAGVGLAVLVAVIDKRVDTGAETIRQSGMVEMELGRVASVETAAAVWDVTWLDTLPPEPPGPPTPQHPCTVCCVTCLGYTFCACSVVMECGSCCCPSSCGCQAQ
jgi:hypothetical protein